MDMKRINAAVKIRIALDKAVKKRMRLSVDLQRLVAGMCGAEYDEYLKRII